MAYGRGVFVKRNGAWVETLPRVFDPSAVPVVSLPITITVLGGAGGSGGSDSYGGYAGQPGATVTGTYTLTATDVITLDIGYGGANGTGGGSAPGGAAGGDSGPSDIGYHGGRGGNSGPAGTSGSGGGGGAATVVALNGNVWIVAGGGGGGGGGGNYSAGRGIGDTSTVEGANWGQPGQDKTSGGESGGGGKIICTKLFELGLMSKEIYEADQAFGAELVQARPDIYNGYRAWAEIVVDWMDGRGPNMMPWLSEERRREITQRWSTRWAQDIATPWAEEMAYQMKQTLIPNNTGKAIMAIGTPICKLVGVWQRVFGPSKKPAGFGKGLMLIPIFVLLKSVATVGKWLSRD